MAILRTMTADFDRLRTTIGGILLFTEDITRRKQAEKALRKSQEDARCMTQQLSQAAKLLGISRRSLSRLLTKHHLESDSALAQGD